MREGNKKGASVMQLDLLDRKPDLRVSEKEMRKCSQPWLHNVTAVMSPQA